MNNETDAIILTCEHMEGTSKKSGNSYDFFTGEAFLLGGVIKYTSSKGFKAEPTKMIRAIIKITPDQSKNLKVTLEPKLG